MTELDEKYIPFPASMTLLFKSLGGVNNVEQALNRIERMFETNQHWLKATLTNRLKGVAHVRFVEIEFVSQMVEYARRYYHPVNGKDYLYITDDDPEYRDYDWGSVKNMGFVINVAFRPEVYVYNGKRYVAEYHRVHHVVYDPIDIFYISNDDMPATTNAKEVTIELRSFVFAQRMDNLNAAPQFVDEIVFKAREYVESGKAQEIVEG